MRTKKEIDKEIAVLKKMKPSVLRASMFGDNHHDAIDAQIQVLEEEMDEDDVFDHEEDCADEKGVDPWRENVVSAARDAVNWLNEADSEAPHESWKSLVRK